MRQSTPKFGETWVSRDTGTRHRITATDWTNDRLLVVASPPFDAPGDFAVWFALYCHREQRLPCMCGNEVFVLHGQVEQGGPRLVDSVGIELSGGPIQVRHLECTACRLHFIRRDQLGHDAELQHASPAVAAAAVDVRWIDQEEIERLMGAPGSSAPTAPLTRPGVDLFKLGQEGAL